MRQETEKERKQRLAREHRVARETAYRNMFQPGKRIRVKGFVSRLKKIVLPEGGIVKAWTEDDMPFLRHKKGVVVDVLKLRGYGLVVKVEMDDALPPPISQSNRHIQARRYNGAA